MAQHRERRRIAGEVQKTVWLTPEEEVELARIQRERQLSSKAEALQMVIRQALVGHATNEARA
jgi:hypothetical protein